MSRFLRLIGIGFTRRKTPLAKISVPQLWIERLVRKFRRRKEEHERVEWMRELQEKINRKDARTKSGDDGHINK